MLHDAGGTFRTQNTAIDRVIAIAFDISDLAVFKMHANAATARAHVTGCFLDLIANGFGKRMGAEIRLGCHNDVRRRGCGGVARGASLLFVEGEL